MQVSLPTLAPEKRRPHKRRLVGVACLLIAFLAAAHLDQLAHWLTVRDALAPADAIVVLDGAGIRNRFAAGLELLRQGYAPHLVVSQVAYPGGVQVAQEMGARLKNERVHWLHNSAVSTREEAIEARPVLQRLHCRRLLLVTSGYHTRRARELFARELGSDGIEVRVYAAPVAEFDVDRWWKTREGRAQVLSECVKLLATWLHLEPPFSGEQRNWLKSALFDAVP